MSKKKNLRKKLLIVLISILAFIAVIIGVFFLTPFFEQVQVYTAQDSADWMKNIDDDVLISDISIPGTHDSGSAYVQYAFIFRCQALTISQQLEAGFRYLDVRLRTDGNDLVFCHSFAFCKENGGLTSKNLSLESVLEDIYSFLENHPSETVIFVAKSEYSDDDIGLFQSTFNSIINKNADKWLFSETIPTLGEARGKIVLYRRYSDSSISTLSGTIYQLGRPGILD